MSHQYLHIGAPAVNVGGADSQGRPLWDAQAARAEAWADAQAAFREYAPAAHGVLIRCAELAQAEYSARGLDRLETRLLGETVTAGTVPKRLRFWRFVDLIARGHTPRDLRAA